MTDLKLNRNYGYDILINNFEPFLRNFIVNKVLIPNFGQAWMEEIPSGVISEFTNIKGETIPINISIDDFFEELNFLNLKDILVTSKNYKFAEPFVKDLNKEKFIEYMDELNIYRRKIAHAKSTFSDSDLLNLIEDIKGICQGDLSKEIKIYLDNEGYKNAKDIPLSFYEEYTCQNNLPPENYDLDGGFVGREKERKDIIKMIKSEQDRIITITGSGGVGKTAIALKIAHSFLEDLYNPYEALIWFSAKLDKLTEEGIVPLEPDIINDNQLIEDILQLLDSDALEKLKKAKVGTIELKNYLYQIFSDNKCLLIIDNLETILKNDALIDIIKDIPRPSQVLITSRKGLGEIERRYPITDMLEKDAIRLFRIISKERNREDLLRLKEQTILKLVKHVKCYPLLIKWSIGQVCLGKDVNSSFSQIFSGESEIAKFSFNDVFILLSDNSKNILYSMIVYGDQSVSKYIIEHLANLDEDNFEDAIKELIMTSFVYSINKEVENRIITEYSMLELTRGFVETKLDEDEKKKEILLTRYHHLSEQVQDFERSRNVFSHSLFRLGIKTPEEKVAFNYIKTAKNFFKNDDIEQAEENFEEAIKIAPNFTYALTEYSKFEYQRGHIHKALSLAKHAIDVNPENYHGWFNYGIMLKKSGDLDESIKTLKMAKELNPQHLPIYNELGISYTYMGLYEEAEKEFEEALKEEKYPNYRHQLMTLQFSAENYRRWSELFRKRGDKEGRIEKLKQSRDTILKAIEIGPDNRLFHTYRKIFQDLGIALCENNEFYEGCKYLQKSIQTIKIGKKEYIPDRKRIASSCFYLAVFGMKEKKIDLEKIDNWIETGLKNSDYDSKDYEKLNDLKKRINGERNNTAKRYLGSITYFNQYKNYGMIKQENKSHIFFLSGFRDKVSFEDFYNLNGRLVSFELIKNMKKEGEYIAVDLLFEKME